MARCQRILEGFSDAFVALKKGYEEFGAEVGVRPLGGSTPVHLARSGREVMDHLLAPTLDVEGCLRDLKAVFADMGIHEIAMMEGITQGIRALLESLDPRVQGTQAGSGTFFRSRSKDRGRATRNVRHADRGRHGPARRDLRRRVCAGLCQRRCGTG